MNKNSIYNAKKLFVTLVAGATMLYSCTSNKHETDPILAEGFPEGFRIENTDIPTRGTITRIKRLPDMHYDSVDFTSYDTVLHKKRVYNGEFEYEIKPLGNALPNKSYHTDKDGNTPWNNPYWTDIRKGNVIVSIDDKVKK